jgi:RNA polymerase sigma-70 factor (ECF subfamily)
MDDRPDPALLRAFRRGDEGAFETLVARHGQAIKGYALRMLGRAEEAEEVYAETFTRVATRAGRWEQRGTVRGWLFTIAHRICVDVKRRRRVRHLAHPDVLVLSRERHLAPSPEAIAELGEQARHLEHALQQLSDDHRQVVLLRCVHGLSAAETGTALGLDEQAVHNQLSYARRRLRSLLSAPRQETRP